MSITPLKVFTLPAILALHGKVVVVVVVVVVVKVAGYGCKGIKVLALKRIFSHA